MASEHDKAEEATKEMSSHRDHIIVRPLPKFVLMYPTLLVALIGGILIHLKMGGTQALPADPEVAAAALATARTWTLIWLATYFINSLIVAFDFDRVTSIAVSLFVVVVLLLIHQFKWGVPILGALRHWEPVAYPSFFYGMTVLMVFVFIWIFIDTRFDYWEITPNEILHHHGFLGDVERHPAPNLSMKKEIHDVFEFLLLGSGRLIFFPSGKDRPVILDNVMRINSVEERVKRTLDTLRVTIDQR